MHKHVLYMYTYTLTCTCKYISMHMYKCVFIIVHSASTHVAVLVLLACTHNTYIPHEQKGRRTQYGCYSYNPSHFLAYQIIHNNYYATQSLLSTADATSDK